MFALDCNQGSTDKKMARGSDLTQTSEIFEKANQKRPRTGNMKKLIRGSLIAKASYFDQGKTDGGTS